MKTKKLSRNAPCPCGSGEKYKRCCIKEGWYEDERGRLVPKLIHDQLSASTIASLMDHLEMANALSLLKADMQFAHAAALLPRHMQVSLLGDMGADGAMMLYVERSGDMPDPVIFYEWEKTGHWMINPNSSDYYRRTVADALEEVVAAYPHLKREPTVRFVEAHVFVKEDRSYPVYAYDKPMLTALDDALDRKNA